MKLQKENEIAKREWIIKFLADIQMITMLLAEQLELDFSSGAASFKNGYLPRKRKFRISDS
ncbi:hypothetical protein AR543_09715 [Paenibacillus bovis]|uniref:Uncharacterized protein n=1 Tax=Paenibacillus bovis TaxID=1616788 RepID=A0A172ZF61_9BACL|nr:hypothetical protein AR543_09715 [Paenibacillus bovis]